MTQTQKMAKELAIELFGITKEEAIEKGVCIECKQPISAIPFKDEISVKEYKITGMCSECQDNFYAQFEE